MTDNKLPKMTTVSKAARQLGVDARALRRDLERNGYDVRMVAGRWRVSEIELDRHITICPAPAQGSHEDRWQALRAVVAERLQRRGIRPRGKRSGWTP